MKLSIKDKSVKRLHDGAMGLVGMTLMDTFGMGHYEKVKIFKKALKLEAAAAEKVPKNKESEPSRSILYRSAATIAMHCEEFDEALRLADEGISGFPPPEIKKELADVKRLAMSRVKVLKGSKINKNKGENMSKTKGFTFIELMIVVTIVGIIAAIVIPNIIEYKKRNDAKNDTTVEIINDEYSGRKIEKSRDFLKVHVTPNAASDELTVKELQKYKNEGWLLKSKTEKSGKTTYLFIKKSNQ